MANNVFGETLIPCSIKPLTGFYRDGCCNSGDDDLGVHSVCVVVTAEFLEFSYSKGNDLSTPRPEYQFPGIEAGRPVVPVRQPLGGSLESGQGAQSGAGSHSRAHSGLCGA